MQSNIEYRPKDFNEIVGNKSTIDSLQSVIDSNSVPHAILFSGPSGCGKTTLARILSQKLECTDHGINEINMSNNRGIDTAREIITNAPFKPLTGKNKIYILDEVHKATKDFQNALLKILEEPPSHVYFCLCTTEPEQLIKTIRNRCTGFQVSPLNEKRIKKLMKVVSKNQGINIPDSVQDKIAIDSEGSPRQALIIYDQIKLIKEEEKQLQAISSTKTNEKSIIELCRALLSKKSWKEISEIIKGIESEPESIRRAVLGYMGAVLLNSGNNVAAIIMEEFQDNYYDSGKAGLVLSCYRSVTL